MSERTASATAVKATSLAPPGGLLLQRKCRCGSHMAGESSCRSCQDQQATLQRQADPQGRGRNIPPIVHEVLRSPGQPLDTATRAFFEPRFDHDFSRVRLHTDAQAARSARAVRALAYTVGNDIVFAAHQHAPTTQQGRMLLGHELAHAIQQASGNGALASSSEDPHLEEQAVTTGHRIASGKPIAPGMSSNGMRLARAPDPSAERAKAVAEANAALASIDESEKEDEAPVAATSKPSRFAPGGFSDADAEELLESARARTALLEKALDLAEKQARRRQFFDKYGNLDKARIAMASGEIEKKDFLREMADLNISWDAKSGDFVRDPIVETFEAPVDADAEASRTYKDHLWDLLNNQPEKESRFHAAVNFVCRHTNPCAGNMEQFHRDLASGMSRDEALNHGMARLAVFAETAALPGPGPSGPIAVGPKIGPGAAVAPGEPVTAPGESAVSEPNAPAPEAAPPSKPTTSSVAAKPTVFVGGEEVSPAQVREAYRANPFSVKKSLSDEFHQAAWKQEGGGAKGGQAPIAFRMRDGAIRVNEVRWLAVGDLAEINAPQDLGPVGVPASSPKGNGAAVDPMARTGQQVDPLAKTGEVVDPLARTGAPVEPPGEVAAPGKPVRQTNYTPPPKPKAAAIRPAAQGPKGYTPVPPEVVVEAYRINPDVISASGSTEFHNQVWRHGGGQGKAPVAFRVGDMIRVNLEAFPAGLRPMIGYKMYVGK